MLLPNLRTKQTNKKWQHLQTAKNPAKNPATTNSQEPSQYLSKKQPRTSKNQPTTQLKTQLKTTKNTAKKPNSNNNNKILLIYQESEKTEQKEFFHKSLQTHLICSLANTTFPYLFSLNKSNSKKLKEQLLIKM